METIDDLFYFCFISFSFSLSDKSGQLGTLKKYTTNLPKIYPKELKQQQQDLSCKSIIIWIFDIIFGFLSGLKELFPKHNLSICYLVQTNMTVSHQGQWVPDSISLELFGSWMVICINYFVNCGNKNLWKKKNTLHLKSFFYHYNWPLSGYHN